MGALALYDGVRRPGPHRRLEPGACPLCGAPMVRSATLWSAAPAREGCRLGTCIATPDAGSDAHRLIEANRAVLADELLEVEFSIAALATATRLAKDRGRPHAAYLEQSFPLTMRRRILTGYVR